MNAILLTKMEVLYKNGCDGRQIISSLCLSNGLPKRKGNFPLHERRDFANQSRKVLILPRKMENWGIIMFDNCISKGWLPSPRDSHGL